MHPNLLAHYRAENTALDASSHNRSAAWSGTPKYRAGKLGNAFDFNPGSSDYVSIPLTGLNLTQPTTLAAWVLYDAFDPATGTLTHDYSLGCRTAAGDRIYLVTFRSNSTNYSIGLGGIIDTNVPRLGVSIWQHLALAWGSGTYDFYVNGVSRFSGSYSGLTTTPSALGVGGLLQDGSPIVGEERFFMDGMVDEVQLYNARISANDIRRVMMGQMPLRRYA